MKSNMSKYSYVFYFIASSTIPRKQRNELSVKLCTMGRGERKKDKRDMKSWPEGFLGQNSRMFLNELYRFFLDPKTLPARL